MNLRFQKYLTVFKLSWQNSFTYRLSFVMWRIRNTLSLVAIYFLWSAVFREQELFGWHLSMILTYVLMSSVLDSFIFSTLTFDLGYKINHGEISNLLLQPLSIFKFIFTIDIAEKLLNLIVSFIEISLLIFFLKPDLAFTFNPGMIVPFVFSVTIAVVIYFFINLLLGMVGFWSPEVWAPRFIFGLILAFCSGSYFPLEFLPQPFYFILNALPFKYLIYFPLQIFLGRLSFMEIIQGLLISLIWA